MNKVPFCHRFQYRIKNDGKVVKPTEFEKKNKNNLSLQKIALVLLLIFSYHFREKKFLKMYFSIQ